VGAGLAPSANRVAGAAVAVSKSRARSTVTRERTRPKSGNGTDGPDRSFDPGRRSVKTLRNGVTCSV